MAKYVCPVCGKIWYNITDLSECVNADAKAEKEAAAEKARLRALQASKKDAVASAKRDVDASFAALKRKVDQYNYLAKDYNTTYESEEYGFGYICASITSTVVKADSTQTKDSSKTAPNSTDMKDNLRDLIRQAYGF